jgi:hypothetical protein
MASEQNSSAETQRLLGSTSLKLALHQTGAQRLADDVSIGVFHPVFPLKFRKDIFCIFITVLTLGGSPPVVLFHPGLCGACNPVTSPARPTGVWPASRARSTATHAWLPNPSPSHNGVFLTFMWIWWAYYNTVCISFSYIFNIIDRTSKWMEAIHLSETSLGFHVLGSPKRSLQIVAHNLIPIFQSLASTLRDA